jgi:hypothetical protein
MPLCTAGVKVTGRKTITLDNKWFDIYGKNHATV